MIIYKFVALYKLWSQILLSQNRLIIKIFKYTFIFTIYFSSLIWFIKNIDIQKIFHSTFFLKSSFNFLKSRLLIINLQIRKELFETITIYCFFLLQKYRFILNCCLKIKRKYHIQYDIYIYLYNIFLIENNKSSKEPENPVCFIRFEETRYLLEWKE